MDARGVGSDSHTLDGPGLDDSDAAAASGAASVAAPGDGAAAAAGVRWSLPASGGDSSYEELSTEELRAMGPATLRDPALQLAPVAAASAAGAGGSVDLEVKGGVRP